MTYSKFINDWYDQVLPDMDSWETMGSSLMNFLFIIWRSEYDRIKDNFYNFDLDCSKNNNLTQSTLRHLENVWGKYPN